MNRRLSTRSGLFVGFLLLFTISVQAQQASQPPQIHQFSLKEAIDYAAKNSTKVKNALLDYKIQEQSNRATTSGALPQITGSGSVTDYLQIPITPVPGIFLNPPQPGFIPLQFQTQYASAGSLTLKQILFDGQVLVGLQARQASLDYYRKNQEIITG